LDIVVVLKSVLKQSKNAKVASAKITK